MEDIQDLSISTKVVVYDRLSTGKQVGSFETHVPFLTKYATENFEKFDLLTEVGSAFNKHEQLLLHTILNKKNIHLIVYDETRLSRNLEAAGKIIDLIKRHNITVHVVGVEQPYVCDTKENIQRLFKGMYEGYEESDMKSRRSKMYHRNKAPKVVPPFEPSQDLIDVIIMMVNGCDDIQKFYDAFNKLTHWGKTDDKIGGPNFIMQDRTWNECTCIKKGDFGLQKILRMFNEWDVYQKGAKRWTMNSLTELIMSLLEKKILVIIDDVYQAQAQAHELHHEMQAQEQDDEEDEDYYEKEQGQDEQGQDKQGKDEKGQDKPGYFEYLLEDPFGDYEDVEEVEDEVQDDSGDMDESPVVYPHQFDNLGGMIVCRKCGRTSAESRAGSSVVSCEFK
jgi:predicted site-specific integrase-resolvase